MFGSRLFSQTHEEDVPLDPRGEYADKVNLEGVIKFCMERGDFLIQRFPEKYLLITYVEGLRVIATSNRRDRLNRFAQKKGLEYGEYVTFSTKSLPDPVPVYDVPSFTVVDE